MPIFRRKSQPAKSSVTNDIQSNIKKSEIDRKDKDSQTKKRVAIVGSGVSGLTCAHYLVDQHDVTVFEANDYIGGHVNTIDVALQDGKKAQARFSKTSHVENSAIDTGFIVFNERTYPNFFRLLHELKVPFQATDMSFSIKNTARRFEYNGHTLNTLLSQRKNVLNPKFWRFVKDILQFNKHMKQLRQDFETARKNGEDVSIFTQQTLSDYLANTNYGKLFANNYLLPMVSAIWSTSLEDVEDFPLVFFAQFFDNHGLLDVVDRPKWFTIKGGSKQYVNKLVTRFVKAGGIIKVNTPIQSVTRAVSTKTADQAYESSAGVTVIIEENGIAQSMVFDEIIFACHADTSLRLLSDASDAERSVLSQFRFTKNTAVLHTDTSVLPKKPLAWASWNYLLEDDKKTNNAREGVTNTQKTAKPVLTYHMNILQRLTKQHNYLVTLNHQIDDAQIIKTIDYDHPVFDKPMLEAQKQWATISDSGLHTHFCGAYWFNGFHEDGVRSGLRVCQSLGSKVSIEDSVDSSHLPDPDSAHTPFRYSDLPVKADTLARKLKNRHVISAETNQELNHYIASLTPKTQFQKKRKRGLLAKIISSK